MAKYLNEALTIWTPPEEGWDLAEGEVDDEPPAHQQIRWV